MSGFSFPETQGRIGQYEITVLLVITISARVFLGLPRIMAETGGTAAWLVVTIAFLPALLGFLVLNHLLNRFPERDLIGIARETLGAFAPAVGLLLFAFYQAETALVTREFAETFIVGILPRTPIGVITGLLLVLLVFASYMGLETISRLAFLYAPYLVMFLALIFLFAAPSADLRNLTPFLGLGVPRMILPALAKSAIYTDIILLGLFARALRARNKHRAVGLRALIASYILFLISTLITTAVFDYPATAKVLFPIYQLARLISPAEFFQRTEAVFIFLWFFAAVISLSFYFYTMSFVLCRTFSLRTHRPLLFPLAVVTFALSLLPDSFAAAVRIGAGFLRYYGWIPAFLLPGTLLAVAVVRGKKGGERE